MKVGQQQPTGTRWQTLISVGALIAVFVTGLFLGNQVDLTEIGNLNLLPVRLKHSAGLSQELPTLIVDMDFTSYNTLLQHREQALEHGVYIPSANDFVTATIRLHENTIPVNMRFLAGPAEQLNEDKKWGFEVRTRDELLPLLDMQRCYLMDPTDNNGLAQWAFVRTLEREGVLAARYQFVRLIFNGTDRGIYGLQEGFANELLISQGRPVGIIAEFDADRLWESLAHFEGDLEAAYADPVANLSTDDFQFFEVDTFRDATIASDPTLSAQKDAAIGLLRALQSGTLPADQVFDVTLYGRFLAIADLWGATDATSLINLRYYYNPTTSRLEPISFNGDPLSGKRISLSATYYNPLIQAAYAQEAQRISQPEYLETLQAELEPEFQQLQAVLRAEYLSQPPWDRLEARQEQIRQSLDPVQPVFAYLGSPTLTTSNTLRIEVANVLNLPVEIIGFDIGGATFLEPNRVWLSEQSAALLVNVDGRTILQTPDGAAAPVIRYARFDIPLTEIHRLDNELEFMEELEVQVHTRILGLNTEYQTEARRGYPEIILPEITP